nr:f-box protein pof6 [Quercus suber]
MNNRSSISTTGNTANPRRSRNLAHIRNATLEGRVSSNHVLASLRATQIIGTKPVLPAELIASILDYLSPPDLIRFALVSQRLHEMVYDDTRWIQKLKLIGVWNEAEARRRFDDAMKKKAGTQVGPTDVASRLGTGGVGRNHTGGVTLFDAGLEEQQYKKSVERPAKRKTLADGFDDLAISISHDTAKPRDSTHALTVLSRVRSMRGRARQEFGIVYAALAPLYADLAASADHSNAIVFRTYRDPSQQAQILSNLKHFAQCDNALLCQQREQKLDSIIEAFENAVLQEFEHGYTAGDVNGRMHRYAHVLVTMNGGKAGVDSFIAFHPVIARTQKIGDPLDCLQSVAPGHVDLNPSQRFFENLAKIMVEQAEVIDRVFPPTVDALLPFLSRLCEDIISDYLTVLFDEAHARSDESYVKAVSGTFEQSLRFVASLVPSKSSTPDFPEKAKHLVLRCFERHVDLYLAEELSVFTNKSEAELNYWEKELLDQEASTETFFMSNVNRQAAKRDFLSSFKKVVMMPVNVLPAFSPFSASKTASVRDPVAKLVASESLSSSRPRSPTLNGSDGLGRSQTPVQEAPTSELAAKAAIMSSRLEGIRSLFSIEVALSLTHHAKASLERTANMVQMGSRYGTEAKAQCNVIFVTLLKLLGDRHVKTGFDKAVGHLSAYNPRDVRQFRQQAASGDTSSTPESHGVEPLVTFLELVNVGDLIQQMIDVFYSQELVAAKIIDRDDFLDPAVKEKKHFEQMLDERVAAGLNKGIDVLIDEVEYIFATTQPASDFNPGADKVGASTAIVDIGPSNTSKQIVEIVRGHTSMLVGSTDKNVLDVFMQEVGLRLFGALCKHFKRQRISVDGSIKLIADINHYSAYVSSLRQKPLLPYFQALRELGQIYLVYIDPPAAYFGGATGGMKRSSLLSTKTSVTAAQAKELATIIADNGRYCGIFPAEEVYEFAERRADWYLVKSDVERAMYGVGCCVM